MKPTNPLIQETYQRTYFERLKTEVFSTILIVFGLFLIALPIEWSDLNTISFFDQLKGIPLAEWFASLILTAVLLLIYFLLSHKENKSFIQALHKKEKNLLKKNEELNILLKSSSAILFRVKVDADFTMLYTSENVKEVLGYFVEEMFVKHFWASNLHPEDAPIVFAKIPEVFERRFLSLQYRFKHKDGSWRWMQAELNCLFDANGKPSELVGNWWDITAQKETQEIIRKSNERFELATKATRDIIYDWDLVTNDLVMGDETYKSFGYNQEEALNMKLSWWEEKIHPDDHDPVLTSAMAVFANLETSWSGNYRFKKGDGTYADIFDRGHITYNESGQPLRWIGSMTDITHQKLIENELIIAKLKAEESAKAKSEFLANMSHEIRTPLNGIVGMTDLALDTDLSTEQKRYLENVKLSCDNLMLLINDILDFSKIDAGMLDLSPVEFSLRDSLPAILQPLGLKASLKKLEFVFDIENNIPDQLIGDIHRLHQIIVNLAGNAIKFTEKGEVVIRAELKSLDNEEAMLLFSVKDTGIGISEHSLNYVFEEFTQGDGSTTRKYGGTGLGLAITRRLVEIMGGKIWVESRENKGSVFSFTLKMKVQKQQEKESYMQQHSLENIPVLLVEDNQSSQDCIVKILKNFGMKPVAVESGEEAIKDLKRAAYLGHPYPIVLLDIALAGKMDGFDVAENIRADRELESTKIIVISMSQKASDREHFAQLGIDQYFTKPFSQSDLLDSIQNTLHPRKTPLKQVPTSFIPLSLNTANPTSYKILLVEDNLVNQEVALSMLMKRGHRIVLANNGEEAVSLFKKEAFDLILMDIQMPLLNGYEATHNIRLLENGSGKHTPIIGLTANAMRGDREKCLDAGMDDYISKPVRFADLIEALDRVKQKFSVLTTNEVRIEKASLINLDQLLYNLDGDKEVLESILEKFESLALKYMESIEENANKGDTSKILLPAHSMKGQCMHIKMNTVIDLAGQIEELAKQDSLMQIKPLIPRLKESLLEGLEVLHEARKQMQNEKVA